MHAESHEGVLDAVVIGGSYAGLSAALQLARARRRILVIDAGRRRNRFAKAVHGFLGQDGRSPTAIVAEGRTELLAYPGVRWMDGEVVQAKQVVEGFAVQTATGTRVRARTLVLATGVIDELPAIEGLAERWGKHVFHCPYCDGYELDQGHLGVLAVGPMSLHQAMMLPDWGAVTLFANGTLELGSAQRAALDARGVATETGSVAGITEAASVQLADGRCVVLDALFVVSRTRMASPVAAQLGCAFDEGPLGAYIQTNTANETSVKGVFACGDAALMPGSVPLAVGDGARAGVSAHQALIFG